jgi:hypothetical protein
LLRHENILHERVRKEQEGAMIEIRAICDDGVRGPWRVADAYVAALDPRPEGLRDLHDALMRHFRAEYDEVRRSSRFSVPGIAGFEIRGQPD